MRQKMMQALVRAIPVQTLFLVRLLLPGAVVAVEVAVLPPLVWLVVLAVAAEQLMLLVALETHHQQLRLKVFRGALLVILLSMVAAAVVVLGVLVQMEHHLQVATEVQVLLHL